MANFTTAGSDTFPSTIFNFPPAYGTLLSQSNMSGTGIVNFDAWCPGAGAPSATNITHQTTYSSKGGFRVTNAGQYVLHFITMSNNNSGTNTNIFEFLVDNTATYPDWYNQTSDSLHSQLSGLQILNLSAGDNLNVQNTSSTGYLYAYNYNIFNIMRIG